MTKKVSKDKKHKQGEQRASKGETRASANLDKQEQGQARANLESLLASSSLHRGHSSPLYPSHISASLELAPGFLQSPLYGRKKGASRLWPAEECSSIKIVHTGTLLYKLSGPSL